MVSSSDVKKININTANYSSLASHPYITKSIANSIIKYRNHHGNFTSLAELKLIPLIDEDLFRKIAFYLTIE
jgi:competence protein ComEA